MKHKNKLPHFNLSENNWQSQPTKPIHITIAKYSYSLVLFLVLLICGISKKRGNFKIWLIYMPVCSILGWSWFLYALHYNAWIYHPYSFTGISFLGMILEDWLIAPIFAQFGWHLYYWLKLIPAFRKSNSYSPPITILHALFSFILLFFFNRCGVSLIIVFILPSLISCSFQEINIMFFYTFVSIFILIAGIWDLCGTTWCQSIWDWWVWWSYPPNPSFYLPIRIGNSPIAITPLFGKAGGLFTCSLIIFLEQFDKLKK